MHDLQLLLHTYGAFLSFDVVLRSSPMMNYVTKSLQTTVRKI